MQLISPFSFAFALIAQSRACVHFQGEITDAGSLTGLSGISASVVDNGVAVCPGEARIDQDGHYSLNCLPGYVFAVTKNSAAAWYQNSAGTSWKIGLKAQRSFECCGGELKNGGCVFSCTNYDWNLWLFC